MLNLFCNSLGLHNHSAINELFEIQRRDTWISNKAMYASIREKEFFATITKCNKVTELPNSLPCRIKSAVVINWLRLTYVTNKLKVQFIEWRNNCWTIAIFTLSTKTSFRLTYYLLHVLCCKTWIFKQTSNSKLWFFTKIPKTKEIIELFGKYCKCSIV